MQKTKYEFDGKDVIEVPESQVEQEGTFEQESPYGGEPYLNENGMTAEEQAKLNKETKKTLANLKDAIESYDTLEEPEEVPNQEEERKEKEEQRVRDIMGRFSNVTPEEIRKSEELTEGLDELPQPERAEKIKELMEKGDPAFSSVEHSERPELTQRDYDNLSSEAQGVVTYNDDSFDDEISEEQLHAWEQIAATHLEEETDQEIKEEVHKRVEDTKNLSESIEYLKRTQPQSGDQINPSHYKSLDIESIDLMELKYGTTAVMAFSMLNADKYIMRAPHKGTYTVDMEKAQWYINKYEELKDKIDKDEGIEGLSMHLLSRALVRGPMNSFMG